MAAFAASAEWTDKTYAAIKDAPAIAEAKTLIPLNENTALIPKPCRLWAKLKLLPSLQA